MFLSRLILNASHPRARNEADYPYELHRTLCKAFDDPRQARVLFRAEKDRTGEMNVIVQSLVPPDWSRIDGERNYIKKVDDPKPIQLAGIAEGMELKFRLRCRPSKRIATQGHPEFGKRKNLTERDELFAWLRRKAKENGFEVKEAAFDRVYWYESKDGKQAKPLGAVQFDGILVVVDPDALRKAVAYGIGPQKAYGFGLLSLARLRE